MITRDLISGSVIWTDALVQKLSALWDSGISTVKIAAALGVSKNAIVGKAHRIGLPARPSPIRRPEGYVPAPKLPKRVMPGVSTLPPMVSAPTPMPAPTVRERPRYTAGKQPCCWPIGHPNNPNFHFCNASALPGKPYCAEHAAIAYVRIREKPHPDEAKTSQLIGPRTPNPRSAP